MWLTLALVLAVLWILGMVAFKVTSAAIHVALVLAVAAVAVHFLRDRARRTPTAP